MLLRFAASCDGAGARNSQCKAYLGAVVVWLYAGKANDAWITYQVRAHGVGSGCLLAARGRVVRSAGTVRPQTCHL